MNSFTIDLEKCSKDEFCVMACPAKVIQTESAVGIPFPSEDFNEYCLECGHSTAFCPTGAFGLDRLKSEQCAPVLKELSLSAQQAEQYLHIIVVHGYGFGAEDSALALSYLELYATSIGLGSCWGGYFYSAVNGYPPLFKALSLPVAHKAFGAVMVGYPKLRYQRLPLRNEPRASYL